MFKLSNIVKVVSNYHSKKIVRCGAVDVKSKFNGSARERAWKEAQKTYSEHPLIVYSSHLESQVDHFSWKRMKIIQSKQHNQRLSQYIDGQHIDQTDDYQHIELKSEFPKNWMEDYEFYKGAVDGEGNNNSTHGTTDPSIPPSTVPCSGCGAPLHCSSQSLPGFIPKEIFDGRTKKELQTIICQRCHFLQHYNIALDVEITPESYIQTISRIKDEFALAIVIVDLMDFPSSIWSGMQDLLGPKRPVFVVGNKVDLLPRDSKGYLNHVKLCLKEQMLRSGFHALNIKYVSLISAKTGYGIEELITQLHKIWLYKGAVYLLGCTNVGKSSLFNILLNSDYCRPKATDLVKKATICPWPGTTLKMLKFPIYRPSALRVHQRFQRLFSERAQKAAEEKLLQDQAMKTGSIRAAKLIGNVGRTFDQHEEVVDAFSMSTGTQPIITLNERGQEYQQSKWCYDTPGVMNPAQITNLLTTEELLQLEPSQMINPRAVRVSPGMSLFMGGLGRLDFLKTNQDSERNIGYIKAYIFCSLQLPIVISPTDQATAMYDKYLGTQILGIPGGSSERLERWPGLQQNYEDFVVVGTNDKILSCDIMLSSAGWVGLSIPANSEGVFRAWTPFARGIYMRDPPLIPYANRLVGKRIQNSLAYNLSRPFVFRR